MPPQEESISPTGTFNSLCNSRPKKYAAAENPPTANDEVISALMNLSSRLRDVGREVMGEAGASGILKAHRQALEDLRHGKGTEAIQVMCHELLRHAAALQGPDSQRLLAEKFREVLASWNAEQT